MPKFDPTDLLRKDKEALAKDIQDNIKQAYISGQISVLFPVCGFVLGLVLTAIF